MSRRRLMRERAEDGAATVELAILATVLVPLILFANFFFGAGLAKLKLQEASRYAVWETVAGAHPDRLAREATSLLAARLPREQLAVSFDPEVTLETNDTRSGILAIDGGALGSAASNLFESFGFNTKGRVGTTLTLKGSSLLERSLALRFTERHTLLADTWNLRNLRGIDKAQSLRCDSAFCHQVQRMSWAGVGGGIQKLELDGALRWLQEALDVHLPTTAVAVSLPLDGRPDGDSSVRLDVALAETEFRPMQKHYTNVFKDEIDPRSSMLNRAYRARGAYYLGCPRSQHHEDDCWR